METSGYERREEDEQKSRESDKMELDPVGSLIKSTLKRSSSAPMINELDSAGHQSLDSGSSAQATPIYTSGTLSARASPTISFFASDNRTRRYSASYAPSSPGGHCSKKPPSRVVQLRQQESSDVLVREVTKERECLSAIQMSQSWEDLSLIDDEGKDCRRPGSSCSGDPLTIAMPNGGAFAPFHSNPSPTRSSGRQCFSPSMQIAVRNVSYSPTPSPSPTRKTVVTRRSMSPIALRASQLGAVKRKCDLDALDGCLTPSKRLMSSNQNPFVWNTDKGMAMSNLGSTLDCLSGSGGAASSGSIGTPESPYTLESPASPASIHTFKPVDSPLSVPSPGSFTAPSPRAISSPGPDSGDSLQSNPFRSMGLCRPKSLEIGKAFSSSFRAPSPRVKMDCVDGSETISGDNAMEVGASGCDNSAPVEQLMNVESSQT
ncbi:P2R1A-PPP2R2A-interacting phosphatase regulator 1-like [Artemia franciscana]|uniref:P2R1A-PPP2R2A-interacting phosphatase regulator 1-like n=1 Tax=Artemia franciscana TaxID=6661 RepID=UPI0032DA7430